MVSQQRAIESSGNMVLKDHDLKQIDKDYLDRLPPEKLRELSLRLLEDLKEARDRLNQTPQNSSRPSSSFAPWEGGIVSDGSPVEEEPDEEEKEKKKAKPKEEKKAKKEGKEKKKAGKQKGTKGYGRKVELAVSDVKIQRLVSILE